MMTSNMMLLGIGFSIGSFGREAVRIAWGLYMAWRFNRDFQLALERMSNCEHNRTMLTDVGTGLNTPKCLDCWALSFPPIDGYKGPRLWSANSATPKEAEKLTRELQKNKS